MRDTTRLYKDTKREDVTVYDDSLVCIQTQQELKISERVAAYNSGDMDKVAYIDGLEEECLKWIAYHRSVRKYRASISKLSSS